MPVGIFMNAPNARHDLNQSRATVVFIAVTVPLYAHQNKMVLPAADIERCAVNLHSDTGNFFRMNGFLIKIIMLSPCI